LKASNRSCAKDEGEDSRDCWLSHFIPYSSGYISWLSFFFFHFSVSLNSRRACSLHLLLFFFALINQTCVKHCSQAERDAVFEELSPHFLNLAYNAYAVHLVKKMLDNGMVYVKYTWLFVSVILSFN